jgi:hypothetical protein
MISMGDDGNIHHHLSSLESSHDHLIADHGL